MPMLFRVSSKSSPTSIAGAIANVIRSDGKVEVQSVGAAALNQAVKAIAIARGYVTSNGIDLICVPYFHDVDINGSVKTAIKILVEIRPSS